MVFLFPIADSDGYGVMCVRLQIFNELSVGANVGRQLVHQHPVNVSSVHLYQNHNDKGYINYSSCMTTIYLILKIKGILITRILKNLRSGPPSKRRCHLNCKVRPLERGLT